MNVTQQLRRLFDAVLAEAERSPAFARRLEDALSAIPPAPPSAPAKMPATPATAKRRGGRRPAAVLDPFVVFQAGEGMLRARLSELTLDQLKDVVAEHGMDPSKLAMKWKKPERLVDLIVTTVRERLEKGDAFRA
ncbi:hypothetical protein [Longimicrobium sp.]|uniref:hypothetical protein n=1 Tax=Longimicrobium sp. TaxID=2029185 RepID=UPI002E38076A|nr:hypothetical protein [Longimicrobium sp.]HEX6038315.1 hypothetical protein [Longimicrobium sp.]